MKAGQPVVRRLRPDARGDRPCVEVGKDQREEQRRRDQHQDDHRPPRMRRCPSCRWELMPRRYEPRSGTGIGPPQPREDEEEAEHPAGHRQLHRLDREQQEERGREHRRPEGRQLGPGPARAPIAAPCRGAGDQRLAPAGLAFRAEIAAVVGLALSQRGRSQSGSRSSTMGMLRGPYGVVGQPFQGAGLPDVAGVIGDREIGS